MIFRLSRPVSCKKQENGSGKLRSLHAPLKYLSFGENSTASSVTDIGVVSQEDVGDPEAADFVLTRIIAGEVEAVEFLEVFTGCFRCNTKTHEAGPGLISCPNVALS